MAQIDTAYNTPLSDAEKEYIERYAVFGQILKGKEIIVYQQTAVGRDIMVKVLESLGAKVYAVGWVDETKDFVPVDTEKMRPEVQERPLEHIGPLPEDKGRSQCVR